MSHLPGVFGKEAILKAMPENPAVKSLIGWNLAAFTDAKFEFNELTVTIESSAIRDACHTLQSAGYNFFEDMGSPRFQLSYHLLSFARKERVRIRVMLDDENPTVDSIVPLWVGANFYEREVFDLFGIHFAGHPDLRRIMLPDDWKGHPLRKDYPVEGYR
jgi:NADH-quinone oxidoreductase subunit C